MEGNAAALGMGEGVVGHVMFGEPCRGRRSSSSEMVGAEYTAAGRLRRLRNWIHIVMVSLNGVVSLESVLGKYVWVSATIYRANGFLFWKVSG